MAYSVIKWLRFYWRSLVLIFVPIIFGIIPILIDHPASRCGYVILVVAAFWVSEVVPLPVTGLIPIVALPLLGVLSTGEACVIYMTETNMMFIGGLSVAIAVEHCNLHKRVALFVILHVGQSPRRLMSGFMVTTMFLSMWISNTATTAMMIPVVEAIIVELQMTRRKEEDLGLWQAQHQDHNETPYVGITDSIPDATGVERMDRKPSAEGFKKPIHGSELPLNNEEKEVTSPSEVILDEEHRSLRDMCFLATAYSANIGGTGSLTGTGPNLLVKAVLESSFSEPTGLNFATWMAFNIPGMILCVALAWVWLQVLYMGLGCKKSVVQDMTPESVAAIKRLIKKNYEDLGPVTHHEKTVTVLFLSLVSLWFFRAPEFIPGWAEGIINSFEERKNIGGATPAIAVTFLLFVLPSKPRFWWNTLPKDKNKHLQTPPCMTWEVLNAKMPWNLILLLGGGFALAKGATNSGLTSWLGQQLIGLQALPREMIIFIVCLMTAMATEVASNSVTASMLMPVLKEMAMNLNINPLYLMLPAAVCCSYAFMLPVATPPNAIAFNAANMANIEMMKAGFMMNVICVLVITLMINTIGVPMFDLNSMPAWTNSTIV